MVFKSVSFTRNQNLIGMTLKIPCFTMRNEIHHNLVLFSIHTQLCCVHNFSSLCPTHQEGFIIPTVINEQLFTKLSAKCFALLLKLKDWNYLTDKRTLTSGLMQYGWHIISSNYHLNCCIEHVQRSFKQLVCSSQFEIMAVAPVSQAIFYLLLSYTATFHTSSFLNFMRNTYTKNKTALLYVIEG